MNTNQGNQRYRKVELKKKKIRKGKKQKVFKEGVCLHFKKLETMKANRLLLII